MDMHDYDPNSQQPQPPEGSDAGKQPQEEETEQASPKEQYPYQEFYNKKPDFTPEQKRSERDGPRDHMLLPIALFVGLLVLGGLSIVLLGEMDSFGSNGMQLQTTSSDSTSLYASQAQDEAEENQEAQADAMLSVEAEEEDNSPTVTLGSGTVLTISETPSTAAAITSGMPDGALSYQEIYEKVIPSVVSITATSSSGSSTGTGIIMSQDGYLITNYHVISGATKLEVLLYNDETYVAALVGGDESSDLAVLKVDAHGLTPAEFGSSENLRVGDEVVAIGDPLGTQLRGTMTNGIISAINRDITIGDRTMTLIQTNAALNSGNSGGPLINCYGQVIGINTMKMSSYYSSVEGLGFAIPISTAKPIIDELIDRGYVSGRAAIGVTVLTGLSDAVRAYYNIPEGVVIQSVSENSDAAAKGLQAGDIILAIEGISVSTSDELSLILSEYSAGDMVRLTIWRDEETFDIGITLMDAHDNNG